MGSDVGFRRFSFDPGLTARRLRLQRLALSKPHISRLWRQRHFSESVKTYCTAWSAGARHAEPIANLRLPALNRRCRRFASWLKFQACLKLISGHASNCKRNSVNVRFAPKSDEVLRCREASLSAMCGRLRVGKENLHVALLVGAAMCSAC